MYRVVLVRFHFKTSFVDKKQVSWAERKRLGPHLRHLNMCEDTCNTVKPIQNRLEIMKVSMKVIKCVISEAHYLCFSWMREGESQWWWCWCIQTWHPVYQIGVNGVRNGPPNRTTGSPPPPPSNATSSSDVSKKSEKRLEGVTRDLRHRTSAGSSTLCTCVLTDTA